MKDKLFALAAKLWLPTIIRHVITAAGGFALATGVSDGSTTTGVVTAAIIYVGTNLWSLIEKRFGSLLEKFHIADAINDPDAAAMKGQVWSMLLGALASQAVSLLSGVLIASGYHGDINDLPAVLLFLANMALSKTRGKAA